MILALLLSLTVQAKTPVVMPRIAPTTPTQRIERIERMLETLMRDRNEQVAWNACTNACQRANPWRETELTPDTEARTRCYDACPVPTTGVAQ